jgi:hypothetical protein
MSHPDEEQLLRYADGEAPARDTVKIRSHLEACWQCRGALEELQETIGECVRYRKNVLQVHLPPPPAPWTDIHRRFDEMDAALDPAGFWDRATRFLRTPSGYASRWAPVAVALIVICILFYRFRQTPAVQAAELLRKAVAAADARPDKPRRIQIRTKDSRLTRLTGSGPKLAFNAADTDTLRSLQALFLAADYDWENPLSARSYQAWRDRQAEKQDDVVEERDLYRIRTSGSGELAAATLTIRTQDLRPVEGRFEFRNEEWVEIAEVAEEATPAPEATVAAGGSTAGSPFKAPAPAPVREPATIGDELQVLAALNRVGADLGDPIEVSRSEGDILVTGVGIAPQRQQEIQDALRSQKHVVVRFSESEPASIQPESDAPADRMVNADIQRLQARMAEQIGGRMYFAQLGAQVLDLSEPMMSRAYALRRLAEQIPMEVEPELSAQDWQILRSLRREHTAALRRQAAEIDRLVRPALASSVEGSARAEPDGATSSGQWQPATEELFQSARRVDRLLAAVFGAATGESSGDQLPSQLQASLAQLHARLEAYDRLAAQRDEERVERRVERKAR